VVLFSALGLQCDSATPTGATLNIIKQQQQPTDPTAGLASGSPITSATGDPTLLPLYRMAALPNGQSCGVTADLVVGHLAAIFGYDSALGVSWHTELDWSVQDAPFVTMDRSGSCYVAGAELGTPNSMISKIDNQGNLVTNKELVPTGVYNSVVLTQIVTYSLGFIYVTGYMTRPTGLTDGFIRKYTPSLSGLMYSNIISSPVSDVFPRGLTVDLYGNMYIAGSVGTKLFITQFDSTGGQVWSRSVKNLSFGAIAIDPLLQLTVLGYAPTVADPTLFQAKILRYDPYGNALSTAKTWAYPDPLRTFDPSLSFFLAPNPDGSFYAGASIKKLPSYVAPCGSNCPMTGQFANTFPYFTQFSPSGDAIWSQGFMPKADTDSPLRTIGVDFSGRLFGLGSNDTDLKVYGVILKP
jgi:hypothetical protein